MLTLDILKQIAPKCGEAELKVFVSVINDKAEKYGINTVLRLSHFLAQVCHESMGLTVFRENMNYSLNGLRATFPKYFKTDQIAVQYARKPVAIANKVYAQRLGNGTEASGDGWNYRGRGCIQITGKAQYKDVKRALGVDVVSNPDMLASDPALAMESSMWWWCNHGMNAVADRDDVLAVTRKVNGGTNGLDDRRKRTAEVKSLLG